MKIFLFIFFITLNSLLIFKVNPIYKPKTTAIAYGISFVAVPLLMLASAYLQVIFKISMSDAADQILINVVFSLMIVILMNLFILLSDVIVNTLLNFQEKHNGANLDRNPVKFALYNKEGVKSFYRIAFFLGSVLAYYGIWIAKKQ